MTEDDYLAKVEEFGDDFSAAMGAEGVRELLRNLDLKHESIRSGSSWQRRAPTPRSRRSPSG
jgi:hypothetical protein